jgi:hypothetical protein
MSDHGGAVFAARIAGVLRVTQWKHGKAIDGKQACVPAGTGRVFSAPAR